MTRITNSDQVVLLLRNQLQRMNQTQKKRSKKSSSSEIATTHQPMSRVHSMAQSDGLSEGEIQRALIGGILAEEFGADVANDPAFQIVIDDVLRALQGNSETKQVLGQAVTQLSK